MIKSRQNSNRMASLASRRASIPEDAELQVSYCDDDDIVEIKMKLDPKTAVLASCKFLDFTYETKSFYKKIEETPYRFSVFSKLLLAYTCYDAMPNSCRAAVAQSNLPIEQVFKILADGNDKGLLVFDRRENDYIGILKACDFFKTCTNWQCLDTWKHRLRYRTAGRWCENLSQQELFYVTPEENLYHAAGILARNKINSLPVIDSEHGVFLYMLTSRTLLKLLLRLVDEYCTMTAANGSQNATQDTDNNEATTSKNDDEGVFRTLGNCTIEKNDEPVRTRRQAKLFKPGHAYARGC